MRIGLLSDTHSWLDPRLFHHFEGCDEIWHAGDFGDDDISLELSQFKPLRGVFGNVDGPDIRRLHPENQVFTVEGLKVFMTHIGGYPGHYAPAARTALETNKPALFICGHSHICKVMHDNTLGLLHINPGAAGRHGIHKMRTAVRFAVAGGKISELEVIELGLRSRLED